MGEFLSTGDVAKQDGNITTMGVLQAVKRGDLVPAAKTRSGMNLFRAEDVARFIKARQARANQRENS